MVNEGIENFELPKTIITRIAKSPLANNAKFNKDTITALTRGTTVFINYLCATAQDVSRTRTHKMISASDVLKALELIEMPDMVPLLQRELEIYRREQKTATAKGKGRASQGSTSNVTNGARQPPAAADPAQEVYQPTPAGGVVEFPNASNENVGEEINAVGLGNQDNEVHEEGIDDMDTGPMEQDDAQDMLAQDTLDVL